ncbi:MAG: ABC-F family ATP-binding cassette domain-containing protein [Chitinispirillaceae bacterium]|nr:ABC-F family ATP-binding cassette domain-containing protein [Chitinispirillaceae bacterium]
MIVFEGISKYYGSSTILENATFSLHEQKRTGLIGPNGSGKTTILRMLGGEDEPDRGRIAAPSEFSIGYLPQEVEVFEGATAMEIVLQPFRHLLSYEANLQKIGETTDGADHEKMLEQIDALHTAMEIHDGYSLAARAEAILSGLGLSEEQWQQPVEYLSGGFRMRAVLGRLLLLAPDFLLLDEPTNHLDMDSLIWLEKYLLRIKSGMLIVSHDRDFLNRITSFTAGIENKKVITGTGNYDQFKRVQEETAANEANRVKNLSLRIARNERFVERFKAKATKATQAQSRIKLIEKLTAELPEPQEDLQQRTIRFSFPVPIQTGAIPFLCDNISAGYNGKMVFDNLSLSINRGDKVAIIGPNGSGKSTFLKLLAGIIHPNSGTLDTGTNVQIRYFGQHQLEQLDPHKTLYETVRSDAVITEKTFIRNILGAFLFSGDAVDKPAGVLSGGEKARLVLATILAGPGNILLLDEPTNHLDIDSIAMLTDAMAAFAGTIVFVSHDEYFVSRIATRIVEMRPGMVRDFPGSLADYRYYLETPFGTNGSPSDRNDHDLQENTVSEDKVRRIKEREDRKKLQRAIEKCERRIAEQESVIAALDEILHHPSNAVDHVLLQQTTENHSREQSNLDQLLKEWEELQHELEKVL